jgi:hypothetical protein
VYSGEKLTVGGGDVGKCGLDPGGGLSGGGVSGLIRLGPDGRCGAGWR